MPAGEEKEQEIVNLFGKKMKENFPNLVREIDTQIHETDRLLNKMEGKRPKRDISDIKTPKVKDKENLKSSKRKKKHLSDLQGSSHKTVS